MRYIITFSPFMLYSYLLGGMVRNDGRPKLAMMALTIGSLSNILLDYVFMYPLNMGIAALRWQRHWGLCSVICSYCRIS